jgi:hypothetical protein
VLWVRDIDRQCRQAKIAHFYKQRYIDDKGVPAEDGLLDGRVRQAWPLPARATRRGKTKPSVYVLG